MPTPRRRSRPVSLLVGLPCATICSQRRRALLLALAFTACLTVAAGALANGGNSIATAPDLPIRIAVSSSVTGNDFWRIPVGAGDELVVDYSVVQASDNDAIDLCFLKPEVTDYTLQDSSCFQPKNQDFSYPGTKRETTRLFGEAGRWTLVLSAGCGGSQVDVRCPYSETYQLTAYLKKFTETMLRAPRLVAHGRPFTVRGSVVGAVSGNIALRLSTAHAKPVTAVVPLSSTGTFTWKATARAAGVYRLRASYYGDNGHRSSGHAVTIHAG